MWPLCAPQMRVVMSERLTRRPLHSARVFCCGGCVCVCALCRYTGTPVYPFGFGLSYSTFSYRFMTTARPVESTSEWAAAAHRWAEDAEVKDHSSAPFLPYSANVTNTGSVASDISVLLFMNSSVPDTPQQTLIGYVHVHRLAPGSTRTVYFDVDMSSMLYVDAEGDRWLMPGQYRFFIGHAGHAEHEHVFTMEGPASLVQQWPRRDAQPAPAKRSASVYDTE